MNSVTTDVLLVFKNCYIKQWSDGYLETVFWDGLFCPADLTVNTEDTRTTARLTGYGDDLRRMHFEHELLHTYLAEMRGWDYSPVLRRVATQEAWSFDALRCDEEAVVLAFQSYLNTGQIAPELGVLHGLDTLAQRFKQLYRGQTS